MVVVVMGMVVLVVSNNRQIYCYDKVTDKSFVTTIENVAVGKQFYTASKKLKIGREEGLTRIEQEYFVKPYYKLLEIKNFKKLSPDMKKDDFESATEFLQRYPKYKDPERSRWDMTSDHDKIDFGRI
jgi:hypothetical protein